MIYKGLVVDRLCREEPFDGVLRAWNEPLDTRRVYGDEIPLPEEGSFYWVIGEYWLSKR